MQQFSDRPLGAAHPMQEIEPDPEGSGPKWLYSRMRSLSDLMAAGNGCSAVCSSGLSPLDFSGFYCALHSRSRSP